MFEDAGRILSGMVKIPTVSGMGNEQDYHMEEYREYLKQEFKRVFAAAEEIVRFSPMYAEPWQGRGVHADNEAANIEAVKDAARCYRELLMRLTT